MRHYHSLPSIILIVCIQASVCLGQNRYSTYTPSNYQPTYSSPNYDAMFQLGATLQARADQNREYRDNLIDWISKIRAQTNEGTLNYALDNAYRKLRAMDNQKFSQLRGELDKIKLDLQREVELYSVRQANRPTELLNDASRKYDREDYPGAIRDYSSLLELQPDFIEIYVQRAMAYYQIDRFEAAIADLDIFISNTSENPAGAYALRAICKLLTNNNYGALTDFNSQITLQPNAADAYFGRGRAKSALGDHRGAVTDFSKALEISPNALMTHFHRAMSYYNLNENDKALKDCNRCIEIDAESWFAFHLRGEIKLSQGLTKSCINDCFKAITIAPEAGPSYLLLGRAYLKDGALEQACQQWSKSGELGEVEAYSLIQEHCQ